MSDSPAISVIVPLLDEERNIAQLLSEIDQSLTTASMSYEVILVDDGSTDGTWNAIKQASRADDRVRGIRLRRNFGKTAALAVGLRESVGEIIVTIDGDLQDDPSEIPRLVKEVQSGTDLVTGWKRIRHDPWTKRLASAVFNAVSRRATGVSLHDMNCGLKAGLREAFEAVPLHGELHRYIPALSLSQGFSIGEVPVNHRPRQYGRSKFGFERFLRGLLDLFTVLTLTRWAGRPGHLYGGVGIAAGLVGFAILLGLTIDKLVGGAPIGDRPLLPLGVLLVMIGVQLVSLGMVAELI
ncbi:MAG TPA: glycosyltransferase family 2 protein, partial [Acidimicrobiales bacterium]